MDKKKWSTWKVFYPRAPRLHITWKMKERSDIKETGIAACPIHREYQKQNLLHYNIDIIIVFIGIKEFY